MNRSAIATECDTVANTLRQELKDWEQSFAATHQGRKAERKDIKQHPEIGQKLSLCYLLPSFTDGIKPPSTSSTRDCAGLFQNDLPHTTPLLQKKAQLPIHPHLILHINVRSMLTAPTCQRVVPIIHRRLPGTCLQKPSAHRLGLHLRRMAKFLGFSNNFQHPQTRRHHSNG